MTTPDKPALSLKHPSTSEEYAERYSTKRNCDNCAKFNTLFILKGVRMKGLKYVCPECGCENTI